MNHPTANPTVLRKSPQGFSLIEVLIVIAIISVLMTAGAIGMKHILAGKNTSTGISTCESLMSEARSLAIANRCDARLMVLDDPDSDKHLQRIVIVHQKIDDSGDVVEGEWVLAARGYDLPAGAYFSERFSKLNDGGDIPTDTLNSSQIDKNTFAGDYFVYEFNSEGISKNPGAKFVIGAGVRGKGADQPRTAKGAEKDFGGFVIWRNGRTSLFRNPDHIGISDSDISENANF